MMSMQAERGINARAPEPDFFVIAPKHAAIHARLENWARWCHGTPAKSTAPMFAAYRSPMHWYGIEPGVPVDQLDAQRIAKAVTALPDTHRAVMHWYYIKRWSPGKARRELGLTLGGLHQMLADGRQMLVNRRA